jgi:hypothetical protein
VLALQDLDPDDFAGHLIAVTFAEIVIQMLLASEVFNSAAVIA